MMRDFGIDQPIDISIKSDSSAALGIAQRRGFGRVRHIEVSQLWLQEKVSSGDIQLGKGPGTDNAADHLTKPGCTESVKKHLRLTDQRIAQGRHEMMPNIAQ